MKSRRPPCLSGGVVIFFLAFVTVAAGQCASQTPGVLSIMKGGSFCLRAGPQVNPASEGGNWTLHITSTQNGILSYDFGFGAAACIPPGAPPYTDASGGVNPAVVNSVAFGAGQITWILLHCSSATEQDTCTATVAAMTTCTYPEPATSTTSTGDSTSTQSPTSATSTTTSTMTSMTTPPSTTDDQDDTGATTTLTSVPSTTSVTTADRQNNTQGSTLSTIQGTPSPVPEGDFCDQDSGVCVRAGEIVFANGTIITTGSVKVEQGGTLVLGTATISSDTAVFVAGTVEFSDCDGGTKQILSAPNVTIASSSTFVVTQDCPCEIVTLDGVQQTSTTLSVTVSTTNTCTTGPRSSRLSTGAVVGIAIGAVAIAVLVVILIVLLAKRKRRQYNREAMLQASSINMHSMNMNSMSATGGSSLSSAR